MHEIYNTIVTAKAENKKLLAVLLDPDKLSVQTIKQLTKKITIRLQARRAAVRLRPARQDVDDLVLN